MREKRDNQRSRVYAWEKAATGGKLYAATWKKIDDAAAWLAPIWRKERGRVGLARQRAPSVESSSWGQRSALAHGDHRITLPRWARNPWVVLHEAAHRLTPKDEAHGPRFVGVLIGLACRHLDYDANELMRIADEMGVKYHVRSIGVVPVHGPAWHVERALRAEGPMTDMDIACHLSIACSVDINVRQVHGAAVHLIRSGKARWLRSKLHLDEHLRKPEPVAVAPVQSRKPAPPRSPLAKAKALAAQHGIDIQKDGNGYWVTCDKFEIDGDDPLNGANFCYPGEVQEAVQDYVVALQRKTEQSIGA